MNRNRFAYGCCEHCAEDPVHDVEPDGHTIACNSVRWPDRCADGSRRIPLTEEPA